MQRVSNWLGSHLGNRSKKRDGRRSDSETRPQIVVGPIMEQRKVPQMFGNSAMDHYNNNHLHLGVDNQQTYELKRRVF